MLAAWLRNGTWCSWIEHVRRRGERGCWWNEEEHISNDGACKQEQVLRKAGQWRLWGHCQSWIGIPSLTCRQKLPSPWSRSTSHFRLQTEPCLIYEESHVRKARNNVATHGRSWKLTCEHAPVCFLFAFQLKKRYPCFLITKSNKRKSELMSW